MSPRSRSHSNHQPQQESSLMNPERAALVEKLKKDYPTVTKDMLGDMLNACFDSEREVREQLKDLGFAQESHRSRETTPKQEATPQAPAKREPTEAEKKRAFEQMKNEFSTIDVDIVRIALDTCNYDLKESRVLIKTFAEREASSQNTGASSSASSSRATSSSPARPVAPVSLEPAGLTDEDSLWPHVSSSHQPSPSRGHQQSSSRGRQSSSTQGRQPKPSPQTRQSQPQQSRAKQVTRQKAVSTTTVTSQPQQVLSQTQRARGPDSSLKKGPDSSLLSCEYITANGPDLSLRRGPDKWLLSSAYVQANGSDPSLFVGAVGGSGPDTSLPCGAQSSLRDTVGLPGV